MIHDIVCMHLGTFAVRLINASHLFRHVHSHYQAVCLFTNSCKHDSLNPYVLALLIAFVEMVRFELMTPCLQGRCSPN